MRMRRMLLIWISIEMVLRTAAQSSDDRPALDNVASLDVSETDFRYYAPPKRVCMQKLSTYTPSYMLSCAT